MAPKLQSLVALLAGAIVLSGCAGTPNEAPAPDESSGSEHACAAPAVDSLATGESVRPGELVELTVENLTALCEDHPATDVDRQSGTETNGTTDEEPAAQFDVVWVQGDLRSVLDTIESNDGSPFSFAITVPAEAAPGAAFILISTAELALEVAHP